MEEEDPGDDKDEENLDCDSKEEEIDSDCSEKEDEEDLGGGEEEDLGCIKEEEELDCDSKEEEDLGVGEESSFIVELKINIIWMKFPEQSTKLQPRYHDEEC